MKLSGLEKIPVLESSTHWHRWHREIRDWLTMSGYGSLLSTEKDAPLQPDDITKKTTWDDKQERACAMIRYRCGLNAREELESKVPELKKAAELLDNLKERYTPKGGPRYRDLVRYYNSLTLSHCKDITEFAEKLRETKNKIEELDEKLKFDDIWLVHKFITNLGPEYDFWVTSFNNSQRILPERDSNGRVKEGKEAVTFDQTVILAQAQEQEQKSAKKQNLVGFAAQAQNDGAPPKPSWCTHCKKWFHTSDQCWALHPELRKTKDNQRRGKPFKRGGQKRQRTDDEDNQPTTFGEIGWVPSDNTDGPSCDLFSGISLIGTQSPTDLTRNWVIDSGCNQHTSCQKDAFIPSSIRTYTGAHMHGLGGATHLPEFIGTARIACEVKGKLQYLYLPNTLYHPKAGCNLISVSCLKRKGFKLGFVNEGISILKGPSLLTAKELGGLYFLPLWSGDIPTALPAYSLSKSWLQPWHQRLFHLGEQNLERLAKMSTGMRPLPESHLCKDCVNAKFKEHPHKKPFRRGEHPLELLSIDISGRLPTGINGEQYWVVITCDYTGLTQVTPIKNKNELKTVVARFLNTYERPERRCHRIRWDQAGENQDIELMNHLQDRGVALEYTGTEQHQENGTAEVTMRLIMEGVKATLSATKLPHKYWPYVARSWGYIRSFHPHSRTGKTPYESWYGDKPDIAHLRTIGCRGFVYKIGHRNKLLDDKGEPCRLLGYRGTKGYYVLKDNGEIILSSNVIFQENIACTRKPDELLSEQRTKKTYLSEELRGEKEPTNNKIGLNINSELSWSLPIEKPTKEIVNNITNRITSHADQNE